MKTISITTRVYILLSASPTRQYIVYGDTDNYDITIQAQRLFHAIILLLSDHRHHEHQHILIFRLLQRLYQTGPGRIRKLYDNVLAVEIAEYFNK